MSRLNAQPFLHASGSRIVDTAGNEVLLKGVGLGGWLLMEGYMVLAPDTYSQWQIKRDMFLKGASDAEIETFFSEWRNRHTTADDIAYLKTMGLNCFRVPMHYELFLTAAQRTVRNNVIYGRIPLSAYVDSLSAWYDQNLLFTDGTTDGFATLDKCLQWAGSNNMWIIPDLHAAPGGQGPQISINDALALSDLWYGVDQKSRKIYQLITVKLWKAISARYKSEARIAMYDMLNETNGDVANSALKQLYSSMIDAVRANGDEHLILVEGNGFGNEYTGITPDLFAGRKNLVWSSHRYSAPYDTAVTIANPNEVSHLGNLVNFRAKWNVPVWVGETGENSNTWITRSSAALNDQKIGWCLWTHKRFRNPGSDFMYVSAFLNIRYADIFTRAGRAAALDNILYQHCIRQQDYEWAVTSANTPLATRPFKPTPDTIPGKIFAADFDMGQNGIAYNDSHYEMEAYNAPYWNLGYAYRNDGVDIQLSADILGNGAIIGYVEKGEWMNYTVKASQAGVYTAELRVANDQPTAGAYIVKADGQVLGTAVVPFTGADQTWATVPVPGTIRLTAGNHVMQVLAGTSGIKLSWIYFTLVRPTTGLALQAVPNPVANLFRIYNLQGPATARLLDLAGRQLRTYTVPDEHYTIDISSLPKGVYVLWVIEGGKSSSLKIIRD